jgi:hypothetical protein
VEKLSSVVDSNVRDRKEWRSSGAVNGSGCFGSVKVEKLRLLNTR